jgi:hypothetical protein
MRKIIKNFGLILSLGFLAAGCATMLGEDSEILTVRASNDATFQARLSDGTIFKVPGDVEIVKINSHRVRIHVDNAACLPAGRAAFLAALMAGKSLTEAAQSCPEHPITDVDMAALLSRLVGAGLVTSLLEMKTET